MKIVKFIFVLLLFCSVFFGQEIFAAGPPGPPGGGPGGGGPPCWPPPCVPIDGGISFLLVAGVLYGSKKVYEISKKAE